MKKWIIATLMTAAMFATQSGSGASAAAPSSPEETGTCSYTCSSNNRTYINRTQCLANCAGSCQVEAC